MQEGRFPSRRAGWMHPAPLCSHTGILSLWIKVSKPTLIFQTIGSRLECKKCRIDTG